MRLLPGMKKRPSRPTKKPTSRMYSQLLLPNRPFMRADSA
jgi:hypothetical protein